MRVVFLFALVALAVGVPTAPPAPTNAAPTNAAPTNAAPTNAAPTNAAAAPTNAAPAPTNAAAAPTNAAAAPTNAAAAPTNAAAGAPPAPTNAAAAPTNAVGASPATTNAAPTNAAPTNAAGSLPPPVATAPTNTAPTNAGSLPPTVATAPTNTAGSVPPVDTTPTNAAPTNAAGSVPPVATTPTNAPAPDCTCPNAATLTLGQPTCQPATGECFQNAPSCGGASSCTVVVVTPSPTTSAPTTMAPTVPTSKPTNAPTAPPTYYNTGWSCIADRVYSFTDSVVLLSNSKKTMLTTSETCYNECKQNAKCASYQMKNEAGNKVTCSLWAVSWPYDTVATSNTQLGMYICSKPTSAPTRSPTMKPTPKRPYATISATYGKTHTEEQLVIFGNNWCAALQQTDGSQVQGQVDCVATQDGKVVEVIAYIKEGLTNRVMEPTTQDNARQIYTNYGRSFGIASPNALTITTPTAQPYEYVAPTNSPTAAPLTSRCGTDMFNFCPEIADKCDEERTQQICPATCCPATLAPTPKPTPKPTANPTAKPPTAPPPTTEPPTTSPPTTSPPTTAPPTFNDASCDWLNNFDSDCEYWIINGYPCSSEWTETNCRNSCCQRGVDYGEEPAAETDCATAQDTSDQCAAQYCTGYWESWSAVNCPKTCCDGGAAVDCSVAEDLSDQCAVQFCTGEWADWSATYCPKTCCGADTAASGEAASGEAASGEAASGEAVDYASSEYVASGESVAAPAAAPAIQPPASASGEFAASGEFGGSAE